MIHATASWNRTKEAVIFLLPVSLWMVAIVAVQGMIQQTEHHQGISIGGAEAIEPRSTARLFIHVHR